MRIYFLGICGTAMGNAALLLRQAGHEVLGADKGIYPPMSDVLRDAGIEVLEGYDAARLESLRPDLVVIGNAMSRGNVEVEWMLDTRTLRFTSLPALLHEQVLSKRRNIVIAGTHGKTTTTALTAFLLRENGRDPGFLIGGVPQDPPTGTHLGTETDPFVIEGDEYDSAFFDKRSKFIHYAPHVAVLNNLEFDHADIFRDLADIQRTFRHLCRIVPRSGWIVANGDDLNLHALGECAWTRTVQVGVGEGNDLRIVDFQESPDGATFQLVWRGKLWAEVKWSLPGLFNARNAAMAACAAMLAMLPPRKHNAADLASGAVDPHGNDEDQVNQYLTNTSATGALSLAPLSRFRGVKRRQEILHASEALTVIEDFGHHPTALAETLLSLRARFPGQTLTAVFEPRSNTARTRVLQAGFSRALAEADEVYIGAVDRPGKLSDEERFDGAAVVEHLGTQDIDAWSFASSAALLEQLERATLTGPVEPRVVVFFSNGSFDGIIAAYAKSAAGK
ncbi:MAG TPA: Mur ligase family protein [Opitutaceae bacterium]|nr:Mur ligase family protein [Opitutaceae bacterium]